MTTNLRKPSQALPLATLIIGNIAFPLIGVLGFGWSAGDIVFAFWAESAVIGVFTILKMFGIPNEQATFTYNRNGRKQHPRGKAAKIAASLFFCTHFGLFMFGHFVFLWVVFGAYRSEHILAAMLTGFIVLSITHTVSFITNYIIRDERSSTSLDKEFGKPYIRIVPMHIAIIAGGGFGMMLGGQMTGVLIVLLVLKLIADIIAHLNSHRKKPNLATP